MSAIPESHGGLVSKWRCSMSTYVVIFLTLIHKTSFKDGSDPVSPPNTPPKQQVSVYLTFCTESVKNVQVL